MPLPPFYPFRLHIPCRMYDEMVSHARRELPNECCGMLGGRIFATHPCEGGEGRVAVAVELYPLINELASPREFRTAEQNGHRRGK